MSGKRSGRAAACGSTAGGLPRRRVVGDAAQQVLQTVEGGAHRGLVELLRRAVPGDVQRAFALLDAHLQCHAGGVGGGGCDVDQGRPVAGVGVALVGDAAEQAGEDERYGRAAPSGRGAGVLAQRPDAADLAVLQVLPELAADLGEEFAEGAQPVRGATKTEVDRNGPARRGTSGWTGRRL
ncbi:hypothetical protein GCM10020000_75790 [Streptomyces olivoverticillatus]